MKIVIVKSRFVSTSKLLHVKSPNPRFVLSSYAFDMHSARFRNVMNSSDILRCWACEDCDREIKIREHK